MTLPATLNELPARVSVEPAAMVPPVWVNTAALFLTVSDTPALAATVPPVWLNESAARTMPLAAPADSSADPAPIVIPPVLTVAVSPAVEASVPPSTRLPFSVRSTPLTTVQLPVVCNEPMLAIWLLAPDRLIPPTIAAGASSVAVVMSAPLACWLTPCWLAVNCTSVACSDEFFSRKMSVVSLTPAALPFSAMVGACSTDPWPTSMLPLPSAPGRAVSPDSSDRTAPALVSEIVPPACTVSPPPESSVTEVSVAEPIFTAASTISVLVACRIRLPFSVLILKSLIVSVVLPSPAAMVLSPAPSPPSDEPLAVAE